MQRGKFIVLEGTDGAGKSTQIELLKQQFLRDSRPVFTTAEPTDYYFGQEIRRILKGDSPFPGSRKMVQLFMADRREHTQYIQEALNKGLHVLCDRYIFSTLAYNCDSDSYFMEMTIDEHKDFYVQPDLVVWLYLTAEKSMERKNKQTDRPEHYENLQFLRIVNHNYLMVFEDYLPLYKKIAIVNADSLPLTIADTIYDEIVSILGDKYA